MINENKVIEEFNRRAALHQDSNAVLDASVKEEAKFSNFYRDYISKKGLLDSVVCNKNSVVLDFGCGIGRLSYFLAPYVKKVIGVDVSEKMIEVAKLKNAAPNIEYYHINNNNTHEVLSNFKVDCLFSYWVMQHISDERIKELLKDFSALLNKDGKIYIFEQIQYKISVSEEVHVMRKEEDYIRLFESNGFQFTGRKTLFRMPSYGMSLFNKIKINHPLVLKLCGLVEQFTVNRKPEHIDYFTSCLVFKLK